MLKEFNGRLVIAKAKLRQKNKLDSMLRSAQHSLKSARSKRAKLKNILAKEQSDVDALDGLSFTGLFHAMLGSKEQRLENERQEMVAAKLKYDQVADTVEELGADVRRFQDELSLLGNVDSEYERVLVEKAEHLSANESNIAGTLIELTQQIADLTADQKELSEAVVAGQSALRSVEKKSRAHLLQPPTGVHWICSVAAYSQPWQSTRKWTLLRIKPKLHNESCCNLRRNLRMRMAAFRCHCRSMGSRSLQTTSSMA